MGGRPSHLGPKLGLLVVNIFTVAKSIVACKTTKITQSLFIQDVMGCETQQGSSSVAVAAARKKCKGKDMEKQLVKGRDWRKEMPMRNKDWNTTVTSQKFFKTFIPEQSGERLLGPNSLPPLIDLCPHHYCLESFSSCFVRCHFCCLGSRSIGFKLLKLCVQ
jgi:hypothetical protein